MFVIISVCVDEEDQLDDMAWLRRRKKRAVSLGGGLPLHHELTYTQPNPNSVCGIPEKKIDLIMNRAKHVT